MVRGTPDGDAERVAVLRDLRILDQPRSDEFEALARLAAFICGTPTAAVNLIDSERQWQAGAFGVEPGEVPRDDSMCAHSILQAGVTYVPDASRDSVFSTNPFVTGRIAAVRLYVSAPLVVSDAVIGTLCAFAPEPAELSEDQIARLQDLAFAAGRFLELRRTASGLAQAATRDMLTGLHNRAVFREALDRAFARRSRFLTRTGLIFIDLNDFKQVNDIHGHAAGDAVLCETAHRLADCVRATDLVIRLGGDEFVILAEDAPDATEAEQAISTIVARVREQVARPFGLPSGQVVSVSASVGWAVDDDADDTPEMLLHRADAAMYADKASFVGSV